MSLRLISLSLHRRYSCHVLSQKRQIFFSRASQVSRAPNASLIVVHEESGCRNGEKLVFLLVHASQRQASSPSPFDDFLSPRWISHSPLLASFFPLDSVLSSATYWHFETFRAWCFFRSLDWECSVILWIILGDRTAGDYGDTPV